MLRARRSPRRGKDAEIAPGDDGIDGAIDRALRIGRLAPVLRLARQRAGRKLIRAAEEAGTSRSTLSAWENGTHRPGLPSSEAVLRRLAVVYDLPGESLVELARSEESPFAGSASTGHGPETFVEMRERIGPAGTYLTSVMMDVHDVGEDRIPWRHVTRQSVVAISGTIDRYACGLHVPGALARPSVHALTGCRLEELHQWGDAGFIADLRFPRALESGESHTFDYETRFDAFDPEDRFRRDIRRIVERSTMKVRFAPAMIPRRVWSSAWRHSDGPAVDLRPLRLDDEHSVNALYRDPEARSIVGVRWEW